MDPLLTYLEQNRVLLTTLALSTASAYVLLTHLLAPKAIPYSVELPEQIKPEWNGSELESTDIRGPNNDESVIRCFAPASGKHLGTVPAATPADIDAAISACAQAQQKWGTSSFARRKKVLVTLSEHIIANREHIARAACLDSGKTMVDASLGEILVTAEKIKWTVGYGEKALSPEAREVSWPLMAYKKAEVRYEPLGVLGACVSWNYPFHNLLGPIISAIFSGNGIVVKGSELTAWSSTYFISIVKGALIACNEDPDIVQSISCYPSSAEYFTSHPGLSHMLFIGSKPVAHHIARSASKTLIPLCIELGGKDALIVLDDVSNLRSLSSIIMRGVFQSSSQNCVGVERIVALPKVYDELVSIMHERILTLRQGSALDEDGIDLGAMISSANFTKLESMIQDAVKKGARLLTGGKRWTNPKFPQGIYFQPTLLVDVTSEMEIANEETFAPICVFMKADSVEHAIEIANSTIYGLGASVFGKNSASLEKVTREIKSGMVSVNDFGVYYVNQSLPFGGVKGSGYGRFAGREGLRSICNTKAVCVDRFPSLISTGIPPVVDYPLKSTKKAWEFTTGLVQFAYAGTIAGKAEGLKNIIVNGI
ncbi:aldehyde dehydrogenase-like protein [Ascobolus immersus RN42]|uniref:aldehyde dehydrogenase (NAD(+)) n=1 Tax=Ascobolus immersus RN42 TaxID=1160509 RepID=A0A3N4IK01_ASCIM|nr:aldehyde dehydrogenase-like protein [Ascobolus immersus RN42]